MGKKFRILIPLFLGKFGETNFECMWDQNAERKISFVSNLSAGESGKKDILFSLLFLVDLFETNFEFFLS